MSKYVSGFFLSETSQHDLGILPNNYPQPDSFSTKFNALAPTLNEGDSIATCGCLKRTSPPPRPDKCPILLSIENREKIEKWLLDYYGSSTFNVCEHQPLPMMSGKPMNIHFRNDAKAKAFHSPIPVPHHWKKQVKADIDRDVRLGIIEPVPPGTPTVWCSRMVIAAKHDGTPRRTIDLQPLNAATYRETHHTPSPYNQASVVPPNTYKTVVDAWNGYHSLPLAPDARDATTFITEWGRFRYLRSPQGFHAAGDAYTKAFDDITTDFNRKTKCVDDTLLWDSDIESAFWHTVDYITLCGVNGIIFNPKKFHFAKSEVDFAGFTVTSTGIKPTQNMLSAIKDFPKPKDIMGARSWFGLVNQVSYAFSMTDEMLPFRDLLKPGTKWYWDDTLDNLFLQSKDRIVKIVENGVRSFETGRATYLATDWSKHGLGFFLLQKYCSCNDELAPNCCKEGWQLVFAGSRFTTQTESRYAPVEGEALAVVYALEKCRMFILGCPDLTVAVDHKPLLKIFGDRQLEDIKNPRLLNLKEKTLMYRFKIKHVPGTWHVGPDACSRYPAESTLAGALLSVLRVQPCSQEEIDSLDTSTYVTTSVISSLSSGLDIQAITLERVKDFASCDEESRLLVDTIVNGFPDDQEKLPHSITPFWKLRDDLSCIDGMPLYMNCIIVPKALRAEVLDCLHSAHQGVAGMKARARVCVYWPSMNCDIGSKRAQCSTCNRIAPSQPSQPIILTPAPSYPFELVVADFFSLYGNSYLIYADRYTGWVAVILCQKGECNASNLMKHMRTFFHVYGVPAELAADGGPPFPSNEFQTFLKSWGVRYRQSSAYYAQSNGRAELAVKVARRILYDNVGPSGSLNTDRITRALLQHRNTPLQDIGLSPAQLLYGRNMKDCLPTLEEAMRIRPEWRMVAEDREKALAKRNVRNMEMYNVHTKELPPLDIGDEVAVQNQTGPRPTRWEKTGVIMEIGRNRNYLVKMHGSGRCTLRNRQFLRKISPVCADNHMQIHPTAMIRTNSTGPVDINAPTSCIPSNTVCDGQTLTAKDMEAPTVHNDLADRNETYTCNEEPPPIIGGSTNTPIPTNNVSNVQDMSNELRRSSRTRQPRQLLSMSMHGKSHDYMSTSNV